MSKIDNLTRLKHIRDSAKEALSFVNNRTRQDLDDDRMLSLALVRLIEIMGEAANNVSEPCQVKYRQFKNEVHQCLMIIHRIPQKGFDSQDIFEDDD
jgi:uncharacterized protein with HEPN domain